VRQSILYAGYFLHHVKKPKGKDLIDTWTCRCERERKKGLREERNAAEHERKKHMIWLLLERFTKHVALFLFLLFASSSLKFVVTRMSSSSMFVAGQKLICTRRALAAQSLFRSFTVAVAAWRSDVLDKVFKKKIKWKQLLLSKSLHFVEDLCLHFVEQKGFFHFGRKK
jgi:hypothetical protein